VACSIALGRHSYFGGSPFCFGWRPFSIALRRRTTCSCGDSGPGCRARGGRPENWSALSLVLLPLRCPGHRRADPNPLPASRRRSLAARSNYVVGHGSRIGLLAEGPGITRSASKRHPHYQGSQRRRVQHRPSTTTEIARRINTACRSTGGYSPPCRQPPHGLRFPRGWIVPSAAMCRTFPEGARSLLATGARRRHSGLSEPGSPHPAVLNQSGPWQRDKHPSIGRLHWVEWRCWRSQ